MSRTYRASSWLRRVAQDLGLLAPPSLTPDEVVRRNQEAWNEAAPRHVPRGLHAVAERLRRDEPPVIGRDRTRVLEQRGFAGKAVAHLCCNNGRDLIALKRRGAGRCVGFDLSDAFVDQGRRLAALLEVDVTFVCADVLALPDGHSDAFDVVLVSGGTLRSLPDLDRLFGVVRALLRPGGWLLLEDIHPLLDTFDLRASRGPGLPLQSYFDPGPWEVRGGLDYYRRKRYRARPYYLHHHKLSDVVQACLDSGLRLTSLEELPWDVTGGRFRWLQRLPARPPLSFLLTAERPSSPNPTRPSHGLP